MKKKCEWRNGLLIVMLVFIFQMVICLYIAKNKDYLFTDEVYSYGLSNSETISFLDPGSSPALLEAWQGSSFFSDYIKFDTSRNFSFRAAFINQANDMHPPLYYCLLHLVCAFFPNTVYSPVPGMLLNLIFLLLADILLYYIARTLTDSFLGAVGTLIFWGLSASCFSNAVLIRMYMMQTTQILAIVAYHIYQRGKKKHNVFDALILIALITTGRLTHYYFYMFAAAFGMCICLDLLLRKRYKLLLEYAIAMWSGVALALVIFPATITRHLNGYRGSYATDSIGSFSLNKFKMYFSMIDDELFAGFVKIFCFFGIIYLLARILACIVSLTAERDEETQSFLVSFNLKKPTLRISHGTIRITDNFSMLMSILFATIVFFYVAVQGSEIINVRYIYPIYPIIALAVMYLIIRVFKKQTYIAISVAVMLGVALLGVYTNGIDWSYLDYKDHKANAEQLKNDDCVIINRQGYWWNVLQAINIYCDMSEVRALYDTDINTLQALLNERSTVENPVCIAFPGDNNYSQDEKLEIMNRILEETTYTDYTLTYDYYTTIYTLK